MGYSVVPQMLRLTRGEPQGKHRANGLMILKEMLEERASLSDTFDRAFSYLNEYENGTLGSEAWDELCEEANAYKITGKTKTGKDFQRSLPQKSTIAIAVIYKLPEEYSAQLSVEENAKFYRDSEEVMAELYPMLFAKKNERYSAIHRDEGLVHADTKEDANEHEHKIYVPKDENENYCGNLADSKMFASICKNYPRMMRERGWDFDDLDITDWDRYKYDSDYRAERKVKAKQNGLSVNKYMKKKSAETAKEEADDVQTIIDYATNFVHEKKELDKEKEQFKDEKEQLKFETDYQMALNETHMNIIKGQFDTIREQQEAEKELLKTAKENLAKGQKKLLKDKIEFSAKKKEQEKREADFQIKEDAQDAQKKALDAEAEEQKSLIADGRKYRQMRGQRTTTTAYENQQQEESKIAERRRGYTPWDE